MHSFENAETDPTKCVSSIAKMCPIENAFEWTS